MIDITNETVILLDGKMTPIQLIRALGDVSSRLRVERDDASVEEVEVSRDGDAFHYRRVSLSRAGSDQSPVETEFSAELVSPDGKSRRWVTRTDQEYVNLLADGWQEKGKTRPRTSPSQASIDEQIAERRGEKGRL